MNRWFPIKWWIFSYVKNLCLAINFSEPHQSFGCRTKNCLQDSSKTHLKNSYLLWNCRRNFWHNFPPLPSMWSPSNLFFGQWRQKSIHCLKTRINQLLKELYSIRRKILSIFFQRWPDFSDRYTSFMWSELFIWICLYFSIYSFLHLEASFIAGVINGVIVKIQPPPLVPKWNGLNLASFGPLRILKNYHIKTMSLRIYP